MEDLIEELIKVNPANLSKDGLELFNKINEIIDRNEELEEENENLKLKERNRVLGRYGEIEVHDLINKTLADDYIPVSLVEETIEELNKKINDIPDNEGNFAKAILIRTKITLQELLEKRK